MPSLPLTYPAILGLFGDFKLKGRTESRAFIAWFLESFYRLDATEVDDSICDSPNDQGIDGIYINELMQQIDVFQSTIGQRVPPRWLGDTDLKEFLGTLTQFKDAASVNHMIATTECRDLKEILERLEVASFVERGFEVRGIFVTNRKRNKAATEILAISPNLHLYDSIELNRQYLPINKAEPIAKPIKFNVAAVDVLRHQIEPDVEMIIAPILASELVKMDGIINQELFAWNLRYQLKRSPVNKEIDKSITDPDEHKFFPAFHNGLTVLAEKLVYKRRKITVSGYAVVNGCQSLNALYQRKTDLTAGLRILTKFVSVSPKSDLARKITDHTNRQNGITGRDLQSSNPLQTRLQTDIHNAYPKQVFYRIARGEPAPWPGGEVIENDEAARVLLAFDLKEPESCHQNYKLFDELHPAIFGRPQVNAARIVALMDVDNVLMSKLPSMKYQAFATYNLTRFLFLYLIREILELPASGGLKFCQNPSDFLSVPNGRARLKYTAAKVIVALMQTVEAAVKPAKETDPFMDYKKDLKSPKKIGEIRSKAVAYYEMALTSAFTKPFSAEWDESADPKKVREASGLLIP